MSDFPVDDLIVKGQGLGCIDSTRARERTYWNELMKERARAIRELDAQALQMQSYPYSENTVLPAFGCLPIKPGLNDANAKPTPNVRERVLSALNDMKPRNPSSMADRIRLKTIEEVEALFDGVEKMAKPAVAGLVRG